MSSSDQHKRLFLQLVMSFQAAAWQQLGKIKNPMTGQIEKDLDQARFSIDMLDMLRDRAGASLEEDEKRLLNHVISELQLNFVDEKNRSEAAPPEKEAGTEAAGQESPQDGGDKEGPESLEREDKKAAEPGKSGKKGKKKKTGDAPS